MTTGYRFARVVLTDDGKGYQVGTSTNGIDFFPEGPVHPTPKEAYRYADRLQGRLEKEAVA